VSSFPAEPDPRPPSRPRPDQGSISRSGRFTPASPAPATNAPKITAPAEAEAVLKQGLQVRQTGSNSFAIGRVEFDKRNRTVTVPRASGSEPRSSSMPSSLSAEKPTSLSSPRRDPDRDAPGVSPARCASRGGGRGFRETSFDPRTNTLTIDAAWETNGAPVKHLLSELITLTPLQPGAQPHSMTTIPGSTTARSSTVSDSSPSGKAPSFHSSATGGAGEQTRPADRDNDRVHLPNAKLLPRKGGRCGSCCDFHTGPMPPPPAKLPPWVSPITPLSTNRP